MSSHTEKHPCSYPGCPLLTTESLCEVHKKPERKKDDDSRGTSAERGYNSRSREEARKRFLGRYPLCVECLKDNRVTTAQIVDHVIPHKGDHILFWDENNWQSLCKRHYDIKTAKEDGKEIAGLQKKKKKKKKK